MTSEKLLKALEEDGDKLFALTGVDHGPVPEPELPSYSTPGRILIRIWLDPFEKGYSRFADVEVLDYDGDSAVFWLNEGLGIDYWVRDSGFDFELDGVYVIEGIAGCYIRGDGYTSDDDEDWWCGNVRRATEQEIATETLD